MPNTEMTNEECIEHNMQQIRNRHGARINFNLPSGGTDSYASVSTGTWINQGERYINSLRQTYGAFVNVTSRRATGAGNNNYRAEPMVPALESIPDEQGEAMRDRMVVAQERLSREAPTIDYSRGLPVRDPNQGRVHRTMTMNREIDRVDGRCGPTTRTFTDRITEHGRTTVTTWVEGPEGERIETGHTITFERPEELPYSAYVVGPNDRFSPSIDVWGDLRSQRRRF